jgi:predicted ATPase
MQLNHPFSLAYAKFHSSMLHVWRGEFEQARTQAWSVIEIAEEHEFQVWEAVGTCMHGAALAGLGQPVEGLEEIERGMAVYRELRTPPVFWSNLLVLRAVACAQSGKLQEALEFIDEALKVGEQLSGTGLLPEIMRLKGEFLKALSPTEIEQAQALFEQALVISREFGALAMELRAATSLCQLYRERGREREGRELLQHVYERFTEGFDAPDMRAARELLQA